MAGVNTVRAIQELVRANGINLKVDGVYGNKTQAAVAMIKDPAVTMLVQRVPVVQAPTVQVDSSEARALVEKQCAVFGVNADMVDKVVEHESVWNPNVASTTGAIGLFQLTSWPVRQYNKDESPSVPFALADRYDLKKNVELGVWYLRYCAQQVGESPTSSDAGVWARIYGAYNLGPGTFLLWEKGIRSADVMSSWAVQSTLLRRGGVDNYAVNTKSLFV